MRVYDNPQGTLASVADTQAFPGAVAATASSPRPPTALLVAPPHAVCFPDPTALCLENGRFQVRVAWRRSPLGPSFSAAAVPLTGDTGYFWFFDDANVELVVKVLDGTAINGHHWVFYGALSDVQYTITVTDSRTGEERRTRTRRARSRASPTRRRFRMRVMKRLLLAIAAAMASSAAHGGIGSWTSIGPGGGTVSFVAVAPSDPTIVYAATSEGGVFVSQAGGVDWGSASVGLTDLRTQCVAVSPADPATAYVGTASGGFKTVNGGASWTALGGGFPASVINSIVIDPSNPATVYAAGTSGSVVKSTNSGATWTDIGASVAAAVPRILAIDPRAPSTLYLGTLDSGVYRSDDGGGHWAARNTGIEGSHVTALAVDPTDPRNVYAGFSIGGTGTPVGGVYGSADGGASWTALNVGLDPTALVTALVVAADATVYVSGRLGIGLQMLAPGSSVWAAMPFSSSFPLCLAVGPGAAPPLFIGYGNPPLDPGGVARWDGGAQYTGSDVNAVTVSAIAVDPNTAGRALAGTPGEPIPSTRPTRIRGAGCRRAREFHPYSSSTRGSRARSTRAGCAASGSRRTRARTGPPR